MKKSNSIPPQPSKTVQRSMLVEKGDEKRTDDGNRKIEFRKQQGYVSINNSEINESVLLFLL